MATRNSYHTVKNMEQESLTIQLISTGEDNYTLKVKSNLDLVMSVNSKTGKTKNHKFHEMRDLPLEDAAEFITKTLAATPGRRKQSADAKNEGTKNNS